MRVANSISATAPARLQQDDGTAHFRRPHAGRNRDAERVPGREENEGANHGHGSRLQ